MSEGAKQELSGTGVEDRTHVPVRERVVRLIDGDAPRSTRLRVRRAPFGAGMSLAAAQCPVVQTASVAQVSACEVAGAPDRYWELSVNASLRLPDLRRTES